MSGQITITRGHGFHFRCANRFTLSVQIGGCNYCGNYDEPIGRQDRGYRLPPSTTAEIAVFSPDGKMMELPSGDTVCGWVAADDVFRLAARLADAEPDTVMALISKVTGGAA